MRVRGSLYTKTRHTYRRLYHSSRVRFLRFFSKSKKRDLLRFLKCHVKKRKNVESVVQVFTFVHFEIANGHFHRKTITYMSCYTYRYNIILKLFIFG